jgi:AsmA protein
MRLPDSIRTHPWRWIAAAVIVLILALVLAGALIVRSLLQPQRFTALLQSQLANAGLILSVDKPASPALWPHPAVQLQGFRLSVAGATTPLLSASEARIVVPWRALLNRELAVERLEIENPRIDLDQLQTLLSRMPHGAGAPTLPRIGAGIRIVNGTLVRADQPLLFDVNAETGALVPGTPFHLDASARNGADRGGTLSLRMLPRQQDGSLDFERIDLKIGVEQGVQAHVAGEASWRGGSELGANLHGGFSLPAHGSVAVASTPAPAASTTSPMPARSYTLALRIQPAQGAAPMTTALKLDGEGKHVDMSVQPTALLEWWNDVLATAPQGTLAMPPISGNAQLDVADFGPLQMRGIRIEAGPQVMPINASTTAAPATPSSSGH